MFKSLLDSSLACRLRILQAHQKVLIWGGFYQFEEYKERRDEQAAADGICDGDDGNGDRHARFLKSTTTATMVGGPKEFGGTKGCYCVTLYF